MTVPDGISVGAAIGLGKIDDESQQSIDSITIAGSHLTLTNLSTGIGHSSSAVSGSGTIGTFSLERSSEVTVVGKVGIGGGLLTGNAHLVLKEIKVNDATLTLETEDLFIGGGTASENSTIQLDRLTVTDS
jgi:hypothetical protein